MASTAPSPNPRNLFEERLTLLREMEATLQAEVAASLAETAARSRVEARRELAEALNQAVRRLRQANGPEQIAAALADSSTTFCGCAAVLAVDGDIARGSALEVSLARAAALAGAVESSEPQVCERTAAELSEPLAAILGQCPEDRACILPVLVRGKAAALLCASGAVEMAPLELLAQAAGSALEAQSARAAAPASIPEKWSELSPAERELHLRAQRFARVEIARLGLYEAGAVKSARAQGNLYAALRKEIDDGREVFRRTFLSASPTMVDYFHLELLRNLANDEPALLGEDYPGPLS